MITFSGVQPSGTITLGNYLGAIKHFKANGEQENNLYCIVDLHALTNFKGANELSNSTRSVAAFYAALGIHEHSTIFVQSHVPAHNQLAWVLQCVGRMGELERMTQFKDKSQNKTHVNVGLFTYPLLMAADILLYDTTHVPVGLDQTQHLELTRDLAERFNRDYGDTFAIPEIATSDFGAKIYSLTDPTKKMSKSDENPKSYISVLDDFKTIKKKINSAVTDSVGVVNYDFENQPGVSNLLTIYAAIKNITPDAACELFKDSNYGHFKAEVINVIWEELEPIQTRYYEFLNDSQLLDSILQKGASVANIKANAKMQDVYSKLGVINA